MKNKGLAIPYIVWMAIFVVAPLILVVIYAFTSRNGGFSLVGLKFLQDKAKNQIQHDCSACEAQRIRKLSLHMRNHVTVCGGASHDRCIRNGRRMITEYSASGHGTHDHGDMDI